MSRRLRYIAQPFWDGRPGEAYDFSSAVRADEGGRILATSADGVLVFRQWIDLEAAIYEEPEVLRVLGAVPRGALAIDADGREPWEADAA